VRGFTLVEVAVALLIVGLGIGALLGTITSSASNVAVLRDKTFARWVALNKLTETRISGTTPSRGETTGEIGYANRRYQWRQVVTPLPFKGLFKIEVSARELAQGEAPASNGEADVAWGGFATGVIGTSVSIARTPVVPWGDTQSQQGQGGNPLPTPPTVPGSAPTT
jgi:general secretion pathway protein I